ncbi:MAG: family 10 glycosylhydrolase [Bacteroidales bacterium]|nr:family 10 glycosylhydrolase [Bacteroidales bacterium]
MRFTPYYIYILLFLCLPLALKAQNEAPKRETRAVWITTLSGLDWPHTKALSDATRQRQQQELCQILDQLKAVNINTVLLQVRVRGSVIYPSQIEPWDVALTGRYGKDPGYDPLAFAIEEAHKRGMELHAWMVAIPCFKQSVAKNMGNKSVLRTHPELCVRHNDMYYLDPGLPGTADYLVKICHEVVDRYDIDGLHFDYIRYPEGANKFNDAASYKRYGNGRLKSLWRRENMTHIVRRIYNEVHALKPWVRMSSSPVGKYADLSRFSSRGWNARDAVHQDAEGWLQEGIHDLLFPMMYFDGDHFYPFAADWQEQCGGRQVVPGLGIYFLHPQEKDWSLSVIRRQLHYLRHQGLSGQAYFRSQFLTDNTKGLYNFLHDDFYAFPALTPACPWLDHEAPTIPQDLKVGVVDDNIGELAWRPSTDNLQGGVRYNIYASHEWPVDISKAENLIAVSLKETRFRFNRLAAIGYCFAVTALDRCGNESGAVQLADGVNKSTDRKLILNSDGRVVAFVDHPLFSKVNTKLVMPKKIKRKKSRKKRIFS